MYIYPYLAEVGTHTEERERAIVRVTADVAEAAASSSFLPHGIVGTALFVNPAGMSWCQGLYIIRYVRNEF